MPEAVHLQRMPSFHGETKYGIDDSGRVMIPAKWRPKDPSVVFSVILWPIKVETFLLVLPPARWQVMLDKLKTKSLNDPRVAAFERVLGVTSAPLTLDKVGRFNIPEHLARRAGIDREVQFVGRLDKFEMWSPSRYEAANVQDKILAAEVVAELDL